MAALVASEIFGRASAAGTSSAVPGPHQAQPGWQEAHLRTNSSSRIAGGKVLIKELKHKTDSQGI